MAIELLKNTNTIEVVATGFNLAVKTVNGGQSDEKKVFTFKGRLKKNKPTIIGTIKLTTSTGKRIVKKTKLEKTDDNVGLNSNLRLTLKSTSTDNRNNITEHLYDVVYTAKEPTNKANKLKYSFVNEPRTIRNEDLIGKYLTAKVYKIDKIDFGGIINAGGGKNVIKITGTPGTEFKIRIDKLNKVVSDSIDTFDVDTITNSKLAVDGVISNRLNAKGEFIFSQVFPSITADTEYKFRIQSIHPTSKYIMYRDQEPYGWGYSVGMRTGGWKIGEPGWKDWNSFTINQYSVKKLTIRAETADGSVNINGGRIVVDGHAVVDNVFRGKSGSGRKIYKAKYILTGRTVTTKSGGGNGIPIFSNEDQSKSDWTNSVWYKNGGTMVEIYNIKATGSGTTTYTLTFDLLIEAFGNSDVSMVMDLDTVVAFS